MIKLTLRIVLVHLIWQMIWQILLPQSLPAQEETAPPTGEERAGGEQRIETAERRRYNDIVGCVRGRIITVFELERKTEQLRAFFPDKSLDSVRWDARVRLADRILLVETARRYAKGLRDEDVRRFYTSRDIEPTEVDDNFDIYKEDLLIDFYFAARLGFSDSLKGVQPDLAPFVRVTPEDIRSYYRNHVDEFTIAENLIVEWILFPKAVFSDHRELTEVSATCRELMGEAGNDLQEIEARWPGCLTKREEIPDLNKKSFTPALMEFIRSGRTGDVSAVIPLQNGLIMARIVEKIEGRTLPFDEVQTRIARVLRRAKREQARRSIVAELEHLEIIVFPPNIFDPYPVLPPGPRAAPPSDE